MGKYKEIAKKMNKNMQCDAEDFEKEGFTSLSQKMSPSQKYKRQFTVGTRGHRGFSLSSRTHRI